MRAVSAAAGQHQMLSESFKPVMARTHAHGRQDASQLSERWNLFQLKRVLGGSLPGLPQLRLIIHAVPHTHVLRACAREKHMRWTIEEHCHGPGQFKARVLQVLTVGR